MVCFIEIIHAKVVNAILKTTANSLIHLGHRVNLAS